MADTLKLSLTWPGIVTPETQEKTTLYHSVLTVQRGMILANGHDWDGRARHWIPANEHGVTMLHKMLNNEIYTDIYVSQAFFREPFRKVNFGDQKKTPANKSGVAFLTHCWVDLDIHNSVHSMLWRGLNDEEKAQFLASEIMLSGLPMPSLFVSSGRGAYLIWRLEKPLCNFSKKKSDKQGILTKKPCSIVEQINRHFISCLEHLNADTKCADASRILRVNNSRHNNGNLVHVLHDTKINYSLEELKSLLPYSTKQIHDYREKAKLAKEKYQKKSEEWASKANVIDLQAEREKRNAGFTKRKYAHSIIQDLRTLANLRWNGDVEDGYKDIFGHLIVSAIARYHKDPETLLSEAYKYADDLIHDELFESHNSTSVRMLREGKCYAYRSDTMRQLLNVTTYEAERLSVLCSSRQRVRRIKTAQRRRKGVQERSDYVAEKVEGSLKQAKPWDVLGISRATYFRKVKSGLIPQEWQETATIDDVRFVIAS